jgi:uncharacterized protein YdeI (YjbR/CyaY-like superfamily)
MKTEIKNDKLAVYVANRSEWRLWLQENGNIEKSVLLILYHKKSQIPTISMNDALEEAICYGWIDSKAMKRDAESYYITLTPRKPKSNWSKTNIARAVRMIEKGLMAAEGLKMFEIAMSSGKW